MSSESAEPDSADTAIRRVAAEAATRLAKAREAIIRRAPQKRLRVRDNPNRWHPTEVRCPPPDIGIGHFTEARAWEFVAESLETGAAQNFEEKEQDNPHGVLAYQWTVDLKLDPPVPPLFIKVRLGHNGTIIGRSFHYSRGPNGEAYDE